MDLGKRIYDLRKEKNLSQEELAARLDVSRQSISKWETNSSIPELEKLIKMSEIFEISLDSLVKGGIDEIKNAAPEEKIKANTENGSAVMTRKIIGIVLICTGCLAFLIFTVLGGILSGLLFSSPFTLCGIICLVFKKRILLWCSWTIFFFIDAYLAWGTSITRSLIFMTFKWTSEMNFARLYTAWVSFICLAALICATVFSFRKYTAKPSKKSIAIISILILLTAVFFIDMQIISYHIRKSFENSGYLSMQGMISLSRFSSFIYDWLKISSFTAVLVSIIGYIKYKRNKNA